MCNQRSSRRVLFSFCFVFNSGTMEGKFTLCFEFFITFLSYSLKPDCHVDISVISEQDLLRCHHFQTLCSQQFLTCCGSWEKNSQKCKQFYVKLPLGNKIFRKDKKQLHSLTGGLDNSYFRCLTSVLMFDSITKKQSLWKASH